MSDDVRRLTTEDQREQFHTARRHGGLCSACGRTLTDDEAVYVERFKITRVGGRMSTAFAAVGVECASPELLHATQDREPERCAGCGRGVQYRVTSLRRHRAVCSRYCGARVSAANQRARKAEA